LFVKSGNNVLLQNTQFLGASPEVMVTSPQGFDQLYRYYLSKLDHPELRIITSENFNQIGS